MAHFPQLVFNCWQCLLSYVYQCSWKSCSVESTASECSLSPIPYLDNVRISKHSAVEATEDAARSIAARSCHLHEIKEFDWLNTLREESEQYEQKSEKCMSKYCEAKRQFHSVLKSKLKHIKLNINWQREQRRGTTWSTITWKNKWVKTLLLCQMFPCLMIPYLTDLRKRLRNWTNLAPKTIPLINLLNDLTLLSFSSINVIITAIKFRILSDM